jgi:hypothetical protein
LNALVEQDHSVARCVQAFRRAAGARPWFVLYTSDHGEAFGEHHAIHHGQSLYDEQIHVPMIAGHGNQALSPAEASALRAAAPEAVTHADILPTLLDLWGLLDHFALHGAVAPMPGRSLLRPLERHRPIPITNCTSTFPCPLNTWGVLGNDRKLIAQVWDGAWRCVKFRGEQEHEIPLHHCPELVRTACQTYPTLPGGTKNWPCAK